jgi:hypothetical protein
MSKLLLLEWNSIPMIQTGCKIISPPQLHKYEIDLNQNFGKWWNVKFQATYVTLLSKFQFLPYE